VLEAKQGLNGMLKGTCVGTKPKNRLHGGEEKSIVWRREKRKVIRALGNVTRSSKR